MSNREFVDPYSPPRCKKCKVVLRYPQDLQKTRRKWWSNCQNCRTANTVKEREKRNAMATAPVGVGLQSKRPSSYDRPPGSSNDNSQAVKKRKHADSTWASSALNTSEIRNSVQYPRIEEVERCSECTYGFGLNMVTSCGHFLCGVCHWELTLPIVSLRRPHICKVCNELVTSYRIREPRDSLPKASRVPVHECSVCGEPKPPSELVTLSACTHKPDTCSDCFRDWITSQFETSIQDGIRCPSSTCGHKLTHADIKKHASSEDFARYDDLSTRNFLSTDSEFLYCQSPGCSSGQMHDASTEGYIFRCTECGYRYCTGCKVAFHTDETCAQYQERIAKEREEELRIQKEQDEASLAEVTKVSVACPGCGANIQKSYGCDHMRCRRSSCGFEFCYVCLAPYAGAEGIWIKGNTAHKTTCKYHTAQLPSYRPVNPPAIPQTLPAVLDPMDGNFTDFDPADEHDDDITA